MLIVLPPSESKTAPRRGRPLDLGQLSYPSLNDARDIILTALTTLCRRDREQAVHVLGLSAGQAADVDRDSELREAPTVPAGRIYTGVLYDALGLATLSPAAKRRASSRVAVASALFGLLRLGDRIPSYRLGGATTLPGLGTLASVWRAPLGRVLSEEAERGLVVDLRSGTYASFWRPDPARAVNLATVRVLQEVNGTRMVVSHFNKATKGRLVRDLLESGANPRTPRALSAALTDLGWIVESDPGRPRALDVIVAEI